MRRLGGGPWEPLSASSACTPTGRGGSRSCSQRTANRGSRGGPTPAGKTEATRRRPAGATVGEQCLHPHRQETGNRRLGCPARVPSLRIRPRFGIDPLVARVISGFLWVIGPVDLICSAVPSHLRGIGTRRNQEQDELLEDEKGVLNETSARVQLPQDNRQEPEARAKPAKLRVCRQVGGHLQRPREMILRRDREAISAGTARHARKAKMPQNKYPCPILSRRGLVQQNLYKKWVQRQCCNRTQEDTCKTSIDKMGTGPMNDGLHHNETRHEWRSSDKQPRSEPDDAKHEAKRNGQRAKGRNPRQNKSVHKANTGNWRRCNKRTECPRNLKQTSAESVRQSENQR